MDDPRQPGSAIGDPRRLLGQVLSGRYRLDEVVGEGGMGAVYRAEDVTTHSRVAVKLLHPQMLGNAEAVARFEREAVALGQIVHRNIAAAREVGRLADGSCFLVLDYLDGEDLRAVIARGPIPLDRALSIARQIALALDAVHAIGIVHRDLKPENVMLVHEGGAADVVKVLDFGIAKVPPARDPGRHPGRPPLTQAGVAYGTPEYMAPEQALGGAVDASADLYSLGVIVFEMLSARRPFDAADRAELTRLVTAVPPPALAPWVPGGVLPPALEALVTRLLHKDPRDRFDSARAVVTALDAVASPTALGLVAARPNQPTAAARPQAASAPNLRASAPTVARASIGSLPYAATVPPDGPVERMVAALPAPLRDVPAPALLSWLGVVSIVAVVLVAVALRNPGTIALLEDASAAASSPSPARGSAASDPAATPPPDTASSADLDAARAGGLVALGPLAQRFPSDPTVLKALLLAHGSDKAGYPAAIGVARHLFDVAPQAIADEDVRRVIVLAASGPPDTAAQAFELISTRMGAAGPDLLFDLVTGANTGKYAKDRAAKLLEEPAVRALASPALDIALDLRAVLPCARKPLFARARDNGDGRSLAYLKPLLATNGCGIFHRSDCYECFGNRAELKEATAAIEARRAAQ